MKKPVKKQKNLNFKLLQIILFEIFFLFFFVERLGWDANYLFIIDFTVVVYFLTGLIKKQSGIAKEDFFLYAFIIIGLISWFIFEKNFFSLLLTIRGFYLSILVYYGTKFSSFTKYQKERIFKLIFFLLLIQPFAVLIEVLFGIPWGDSISGTLGNNKNQILLLLMIVFVAMSLSLYFQKKISVWKFLLYVSLSTIPPLIASTLFYFLLMPLFIILAFQVKRSVKYLFILLIITTLFISAMPEIASLHDKYRTSGNMENFMKNPEKILTYGKYGTKSNSFGRQQVAIYIFQKIKDFNETAILIGNGIGSTKQSQTKKWRGKIENLFPENKFGRILYSYLILEYGVLGTLSFLFFLYLHYKKAKINNNFLILFLIIGILFSGFYQNWLGALQPAIIAFIFLGFNKKIKNQRLIKPTQ